MSGSSTWLGRPKPILMRERSTMIFIERGRVDVKDNAFVIVNKEGARTHVPVGGFACVLLEPGTRISHAAVKLAAQTGTLLIWVGEGGVRLYASGQPGGTKSERLLWQARLALDPAARRNVAREMFARRFGETPPVNRSINQLRGMEGGRVKALYAELAAAHGIVWRGRRYDRTDPGAADIANQCLSAGNVCLYGLAEAAILAAGYAPAVGFVHSGLAQSFVFDIADLYKFETVVPAAFEAAAKIEAGGGTTRLKLEGAVRRACRDMFRKADLLSRLVPDIESVLLAGGLAPPKAPKDAQPLAWTPAKPTGEEGHRS